MKGLSFQAGGELFTVDVTLVYKVVRNMPFTPLPASSDTVVGIAGMKGRVITVLSLTELLGRGRSEQARDVVIFKPAASGNDQMGLIIDKPGELIDIDENEILPPPKASREEEHLCIAGMIEIDGVLYRIICVDSIISGFKYAGENASGAISQRGNE